MKEAISSQEKPTAETTTSTEVELSDIPSTSQEICHSVEEAPIELSAIPSTSQEIGHSEEETCMIGDIFLEPGPANEPDMSPAFVECAQLSNENRKLSNKLKTLRGIVTRRSKEVKTYRRKINVLQSRIARLQTAAKNAGQIEEAEQTSATDNDEHDDGDNYEMEEDELEYESGSQYETEQLRLKNLLTWAGKIFPTIQLYWEEYQKKALEKVKNESCNGVVVAGDGRQQYVP
ncbi:Hypothetical predicted protein [Paramuricea clavata]|uniref:Uncharacterized protein n=1 Tax=Paramuricea clavata TaxID=317549 RepID=A0A6S7JV32_PARCT|nr:Hypothetical predicted protein [Paramuricea clavata]